MEAGEMVPEKIRRRKGGLGVLKRITAIEAKRLRLGQSLGGVAMDSEIDSKLFWRMRKVTTGKDASGSVPND